MPDIDNTAETVDAMARDLLRAGQADAADMLRQLLARAQAAERERDALRSGSAGAKGPEATLGDQGPEVGESLEEIVKGEHLGP